jgi:hypothetical protein
MRKVRSALASVMMWCRYHSGSTLYRMKPITRKAFCVPVWLLHDAISAMKKFITKLYEATNRNSTKEPSFRQRFSY